MQFLQVIDQIGLARMKLTFVAGAIALTAVACTSRQAATGMPAQATPPCCTRDAFAAGLRAAERYRNPGISVRRFTYDEFWRAVDGSVRSTVFRVEPIGASVLGREIRAVTFGSGPTRVLMWSQMHGDEATATMALADVFRFLAEAGDDPVRERIRRELTVTFVPMLNPDGAELFQRENAAGIDVNRDARRQVTPEARALAGLQQRIRPAFGFNLHDQNARTRVGRQGLQSAIALLPPAFDAAGSYNEVRARARLVAATLATAFAHEIPGRIAKYDDAYNPRAFGDLMQQWGVSTVLIESGALPNDPQKQRLRFLNAAALIMIMDALATRGYEAADPQAYESLPFNTGGATDLLVRGAQLVLPEKSPMVVDLAINFDDAVARTGGRIRDVGDLAGTVALDTVDAAGLYLHPAPGALTRVATGTLLRIGATADFTLRRGAEPSSEAVRRIGSP